MSFHTSPKAWADIKHSILSQYLPLFLGKLGKGHSRVYCVDGFAGPGRLKDGSKGSPLLAAETALHPTQASRHGVLHCINVEVKPDVFADLETATKSFDNVQNIFGDFTKKLPQILEIIGNHPAIFFIDPFGTQGVELPTLKVISERGPPTEVLVRYDDTRVKRLISLATNHKDSLDAKMRATAESLWSRVSTLTDEQAAEIALAQMNDAAKEEARQTLIDSYCTLVKAETAFRFALSFPIRNPKTRGHRYYLAHFCAHPDGYVYMANFMASAARAYERLAGDAECDIFAVNTQQMNFPSIDEHIQKETRAKTIAMVLDALPEIVKREGWSGAKVQNRDVFRNLVDRFGWKVMKSEYVAALKKSPQMKLTSADDSSSSMFNR